MRSLIDRPKNSTRFVATLFAPKYGQWLTRRHAKHWLGAVRRRPLRTLICLAIIVNLLIWPAPGVTLRPVLDPMSVLASTVTSSINAVRETLVVKLPVGLLVLPVPMWLFTASTAAPTQLSMAERISRVASINVSPHRYVGYVSDNVTFVAMGKDALGQPAHGAKFTWESSDPSKLTIDEAGRATLLAAGLVTVTARAGLAVKAAPVLIRPTRRRLQTDAEWRADQDSLVASSDGQSTVESVVASLMDRLVPTVHAQGGQGADYGNAAPIGQVGTPPFAALEDTRLGPVMPQTNFELPLSLVDLGGRGLATSLMAYYNSNLWGARFDPVLNGTVYVFDPIQSWPSPGFSLGFGRIVIYAYNGPGYQYVLVDPNGTRHSLGAGPDSGAATLQTTDGSHITYVGGPMGGTVYYQDSTQMTIGLVNNRRLCTQVTDTNGNYIQIAYKSETNFPAIAISYIVDTLGRVISFNYGEWPAPSSTSLSSIATPVGSVTFSYQTVTMNYNFLSPVAVENAPSTFY